MKFQKLVSQSFRQALYSLIKVAYWVGGYFWSPRVINVCQCFLEFASVVSVC